MKVRVKMPQLYPAQQQMLRAIEKHRRVAICFGRRAGKTTTLSVAAAKALLHGQKVGYFAPQSRHTDVAYKAVDEILAPLGGRVRTNKSANTIELPFTGGEVSFIPIDRDADRARGMTLNLAIFDEAAFAEDRDGQFEAMVQTVVMPTLLTTSGKLVMSSTPNGRQNYFFKIFHDPMWAALTAPSWSNPTIPLEEFALLKKQMDSRAYAQEVEAAFVDLGADAWFKRDNAYADGQPVPYPSRCDCVFAIVDSALKSGTGHDGTGIVWYAFTENPVPGHPKLFALDYDYIQLDANILLTVFPAWLTKAEELAKACGARGGSIGIAIEDKGSGIVMVQAAKQRNLPVIAVDSGMTSRGKDERAYLCGTFYNQGLFKITQTAHDRLISFKNQTRNHFLEQLFSFRLNDKNAYRRSDDLLDCATYAMLYADESLRNWR